MKKIAIFALALLFGQSVAQPTEPFDGFWSCRHHPVDEDLRVCSAVCEGDTGPPWVVIPEVWTCPGSELGTPGDSVVRCTALANENPPLCCPPGTECSRTAQPDPDPDPEPGTEGSANALSGGNDNFRNGVLLAGGIVIAGAWLYNTMQPPLPDGLTFKPYAHLDYSGGIPATSAGFRGEYGNWAFSAASVNTRGEWIRPYARVRWSWVF